METSTINRRIIKPIGIRYLCIKENLSLYRLSQSYILPVRQQGDKIFLIINASRLSGYCIVMALFSHYFSMNWANSILKFLRSLFVKKNCCK